MQTLHKIRMFLIIFFCLFLLAGKTILMAVGLGVFAVGSQSALDNVLQNRNTTIVIESQDKPSPF